jgi:hypothetical protein
LISEANITPYQRRRQVIDVDLEGENHSRHTTVNVLQIYKDWNGQHLDRARHRFQSLIFARDGAVLKSQAPANAMNYKLVLHAAKAVMPAKEYASFRDQMDRAYQNKEKS